MLLTLFFILKRTLYLSIAFNLTSFDFFVSPENVIKSLVFIGRQKIQLPLNSTYHFDMLFETICKFFPNNQINFNPIFSYCLFESMKRVWLLDKIEYGRNRS